MQADASNGTQGWDPGRLAPVLTALKKRDLALLAIGTVRYKSRHHFFESFLSITPFHSTFRTLTWRLLPKIPLRDNPDISLYSCEKPFSTSICPQVWWLLMGLSERVDIVNTY